MMSSRDARDLDVHLQRSDALLGARHLEIHVAEMVFVAQDVGQNFVAVIFEDQTHRNAGDRRRNRHARIHQRQRRAADRGHRGRAVRLGDLGDEAHRVRELLWRSAAPPSSRATPICRGRFRGGRPAHTAGFTDAVGREIVVQHEALFGGAGERVDELLILAGAERGDDDGLGFTAGEQRRAVRARQEADSCLIGRTLVDRAAVDAALFLDDARAHDIGFHGLEGFLEHVGVARPVGVRVALHQSGLGFIAQRADGGVTQVLLAVIFVGVGADARLDEAERSWLAARSRSGGSNANGSLPACSARSMIASITGWQCLGGASDQALRAFALR